MEEALRSILTGSAAVTGHLGTRVYLGTGRQGKSLPFVVMNTITGIRDYSLSGATDLVESRVQVDCFADAYSGAKELARDVMAAVSAYQGETADIYFGGIFVDSERDLNDPDQGDTRTVFRVSIDLTVWWRAT